MSTRRDDVVDEVHGVPVADPYRWLEDGSRPEVRAWTAAQNQRARHHLDALPGRPELRHRLLQLLSVPTVGSPTVKGQRLFTLERGGPDHPGDQAVLVVRSALACEPGQPGRVLVDPQRLVGDDTAALDWYHPSFDGSVVAFGVSVDGDERSTLRLLDVAGGERLGDEIPNTRAASVAWLGGNDSFAYTRYPSDGDHYHRQVWTHVIGTDPAGDALLWGNLPDPAAWPDVSVSADGRWLLVHVSVGWDRTDVHLLDRNVVSPDGAGWVTLIEGVDALTSLQLTDDQLVGTTTLDAPRGRVVASPLAQVGPLVPGVGWSDVVAETDAVIEGVAVSPGSLMVLSTRSAVSELHRHPRHGRAGGAAAEAVALPEPGSVSGWSASQDRDEVWFSFTSFTRPEQLFRWTPAEGVLPGSAPAGAIEPEHFSVEQARYRSSDATSVQIFLVQAATQASGPHPPEGAETRPTILTGYGGFGVTMGPAFSPLAVVHAETGGLFAVACIRGGAEEGEAWHRAGQRQHKQQVFDDFAAAADWLVETGRTRPEQLAIRGGSNGGLLVAATLTQRPSLCRAVHCAVPLTDMVRFPRFLIAKLWVPEYGDPEVAEDFAWLYAYSPYHRLVDGTCYPAVLVTTGAEDSRVDPCHARKFAARLQEASSCGDEHPILVRVEGQAGHGQGKPIGRQADELTDVAAFLWSQLGVSAHSDDC